MGCRFTAQARRDADQRRDRRDGHHGRVQHGVPRHHPADRGLDLRRPALPGLALGRLPGLRDSPCRLIAGQGTGTYSHYFYLFLDTGDVLLSILKVVVLGLLITFIHCFYGYTASGGPEGVGVASGRAIRASIVTIALADMLMTLLFWGTSTGVRV
ncbi:ABC transporter permease [Nocardioides sp. W3-2-3]|uniref:ABC transporter permease n=1 Tax=Nocardioides convexus TaxID=2712224 RepID=UPI00241892DC|nr:ABC transporter permease [Nocardioides convexus]NHA00076.1 ABC transporter permease [Nocardioides convexus]